MSDAAMEAKELIPSSEQPQAQEKPDAAAEKTKRKPSADDEIALTATAPDAPKVIGTDSDEEDLPAYDDLKIATIGNVDSGKSTLVGVLTKAILDDGRGSARSRVFNFAHEQANGRTSSIAQEIMGFRDDGKQVTFDHQRQAGSVSVAARKQQWTQVVAQSSKVVTFIDLCGHEKYLKTTIFGLTGLYPDYAMIVVNANAGFQRMTREHLGIALALKVPVFFVVTKIDIAPDNVFTENMHSLCRLLKSNAVKLQPLIVRTMADAEQGAQQVSTHQACPIFCVSNVTGDGLDPLRCFMASVASRTVSSGVFNRRSAPVEFQIDGIYQVPGVGIVVAGTIMAGTVTPNMTLMLGPDKSGHFKPVLVRSIHTKRTPVEQAVAGQGAAFALRSLVKKDTLKRSTFRKGMVMVAPELSPKAVREFEAEVVILHHATTIKVKYQAVIHCGVIRQSAQVREIRVPLLRAGDKGIIRFRFVNYGEYIKLGQTLLFREGRTKGLGTVVLLDPPPMPGDRPTGEPGKV